MSRDSGSLQAPAATQKLALSYLEPSATICSSCRSSSDPKEAFTDTSHRSLGLAGSQAERNENGTERKKDGTELKRCENAVPRKRSHRRTIVRRSSNVNFLLTGPVSGL